MKQEGKKYVFKRLSKEERKLAWQAPKENAGAGWQSDSRLAAGNDFDVLDQYGCYQKRRTEIE